jgi:uncharacterized membrane protein YedE/YeeE
VTSELVVNFVGIGIGFGVGCTIPMMVVGLILRLIKGIR